MYACPKCGYRLPLMWHSYRWVTDMFHGRIEDFQREYPTWKDLKHGQIVEDEIYFFRRTKKGDFVQMCNLALAKGMRLLYSQGLVDKDGRVIAGKIEDEVFQALGLPFIIPQDREVETK